MSAPVPVALVGCAHIHTPGFIKTLLKRQADVSVAGVWDPDPARAAKRAQELGAPVCERVEQIWEDRSIEAVVICSETSRHEDLVRAAAKAKKHLFVEKPLGMGGRDAMAMADAIEKAAVLFQTGYFMRGDPKVLFIKQQLEEGALGKVTRIRGSNAHAGALAGWFDGEWRWMADPRQAGVGAYGDLGTHCLDLMMWLMGDVQRVAAVVSEGTGRYAGCDELGEGLLVFRNGVLGTLAAGWDDVANPVTLEVCGTEGHATVVNGELYFQSKQVEGADGTKPWAALPPAWASPLERFLNAVCGAEGVPLVEPREAAARSAVTDALYAAAREHKWVEIE